MSLPRDCPSCTMGDHSGHDERHGLTPGLIGGTYCACGGDCAARFKAVGDLMRAEWAAGEVNPQ